MPPSYAQPRPPAVLVGAIHGDDSLGVFCLATLCDDLLERPPGRHTWIIPALNVDGLAGGSKNNARDVDLNRNFATTDWAAEHKPGYYPGPAPESEPETQALAQLIERVAASRVVALHSPYHNVSWGGTGKALAATMAALNGYEVVDSNPNFAPGSLGAKYGRECNLEVVILEIPFGSEEQAWQQNRAALRSAVDLPT